MSTEEGEKLRKLVRDMVLEARGKKEEQEVQNTNR